MNETAEHKTMSSQCDYFDICNLILSGKSRFRN